MYRYKFLPQYTHKRGRKTQWIVANFIVKRNPIGVDLALSDCLPKTHKELDGYLDGHVGFEWKVFNVF